MTNDLARFESLFQDEAQLRKAIGDLLRRMSSTGIHGVQETHGTQELGKDIVFYSRGPLNERRLHACVIKNTKISGSVSAPSGAMTVLSQVQQALDNPYLSLSGERERVTSAYVMSPCEISQAAIHSIEGSLEKRSGQVIFCCGSTLFDLFQQHWPDFLLFESGALGTYVTHLHSSIEKDDPVAVLVEQHGLLASAVASLRNKYVQQGLKLRLRNFYCDVAFPDVEVLRKAVASSDIDELKESVSTLAGFVSAPDLYEDSGLTEMQGRDLSGELTAFANHLQPAWEAAAKKYSEGIAKEGKRAPARKFLKVVVFENERLLSEAAASIGLARKIFDKFQQRLSAANEFATSSAQLRVPAFGPELLSYCYIQSVYRVLPQALRASSVLKTVRYEPDALDRTRASALITGPAGYGKTSFCRWHALQDVDQLQMKQSDILPVYVPLHQLSSKRLGDYRSEFFPSAELRELIQRDHQGISKRIATIRIYLDGLDEVPRHDRRRDILALARAALDGDSRVQIIVTAREHVAGPWLSWLPRMQINELQGPQIRELVSNLLDRQEERVNEFFGELEQVRTLAPLMHIPLLGTLIVAVYTRTKRLPPNRIRLYDIFTQLLAGGWDLAKNVRRNTQFGPTPKLFALQQVAALMHGNHLRECPETEIVRVFTGVSSSLAARDQNALFQEILEDGLLVRSGSGYAFSHLSFQEYFAAKDLADPNGKRQTEVLRGYFNGDDWWREVLAFYIGMASNPDEIHLWINKNTVQSSRARTDVPRRYDFLIQCIKATYPGWTPGTRWYLET